MKFPEREEIFWRPESYNLNVVCLYSFVYHYLLEEKTQPNGKIMYSSEKQSQKHLALVSTITQEHTQGPNITSFRAWPLWS